MVKRVVKSPDVRRLEIIRAAEKLFEKNGYAKTPVEAIIKEVGIAKGTFYYYFKAKQDILRALVEHIGSEVTAHFSAIVEASNLSAVEKLYKMLRGSEKKAKTSSSIMKIIHKPENRELQEQLNIQSIKIIAPLIAKVLKQGKKEGIFTKEVSIESIQLIFSGTQFVLDSGLFRWSPKKRVVFLQSTQVILELLTGAPSGLLHFISEE